MSNKQSCPDCGPTPIIHWISWLFAVGDWLLRPLAVFLQLLDRIAVGLIPSVITYAGLGLVQIALFFRIGVLSAEPDEKDNYLTKATWESAKKRGIDIKEFRFFGFPEPNFFIARHGRKVIFYDGLPTPPGGSPRSIFWMGDKAVLKEFFLKNGIPVAAGGSAITFSEAEAIFQRIGSPVIVKPRFGSRSRHTFVNVTLIQELKTAFRSAKKLSPWVIIEKELIGRVFRVTVIGGKVVAVLRRDPVGITGDGTLTIRECIEKENKNPARHGPIFHEISIDEDMFKELSKQNLTLESVPDKNEFVALNSKSKVSRGSGASNTDATDLIHPDTCVLLEQAAKKLDSQVVGIDFIIEDISRSWKEQKDCGIIECNTQPFLDLHHYPLYGTSRDAAGALWDLIFPASLS